MRRRQILMQRQKESEATEIKNVEREIEEKRPVLKLPSKLKKVKPSAQ